MVIPVQTVTSSGLSVAQATFQKQEQQRLEARRARGQSIDIRPQAQIRTVEESLVSLPKVQEQDSLVALKKAEGQQKAIDLQKEATIKAQKAAELEAKYKAEGYTVEKDAQGNIIKAYIKESIPTGYKYERQRVNGNWRWSQTGVTGYQDFYKKEIEFDAKGNPLREIERQYDTNRPREMSGNKPIYSSVKIYDDLVSTYDYSKGIKVTKDYNEEGLRKELTSAIDSGVTFKEVQFKSYGERTQYYDPLTGKYLGMERDITDPKAYAEMKARQSEKPGYTSGIIVVDTKSGKIESVSKNLDQKLVGQTQTAYNKDIIDALSKGTITSEYALRSLKERENYVADLTAESKAALAKAIAEGKTVKGLESQSSADIRARSFDAKAQAILEKMPEVKVKDIIDKVDLNKKTILSQLEGIQKEKALQVPTEKITKLSPESIIDKAIEDLARYESEKARENAERLKAKFEGKELYTITESRVQEPIATRSELEIIAPEKVKAYFESIKPKVQGKSQVIPLNVDFIGDIQKIPIRAQSNIIDDFYGTEKFLKDIKESKPLTANLAEIQKYEIPEYLINISKEKQKVPEILDKKEIDNLKLVRADELVGQISSGKIALERSEKGKIKILPGVKSISEDLIGIGSQGIVIPRGTFLSSSEIISGKIERKKIIEERKKAEIELEKKYKDTKVKDFVTLGKSLTVSEDITLNELQQRKETERLNAMSSLSSIAPDYLLTKEIEIKKDKEKKYTDKILGKEIIGKNLSSPELALRRAEKGKLKELYSGEFSIDNLGDIPSYMINITKDVETKKMSKVRSELLVEDFKFIGKKFTDPSLVEIEGVKDISKEFTPLLSTNLGKSKEKIAKYYGVEKVSESNEQKITVSSNEIDYISLGFGKEPTGEKIRAKETTSKTYGKIGGLVTEQTYGISESPTLAKTQYQILESKLKARLLEKELEKSVKKLQEKEQILTTSSKDINYEKEFAEYNRLKNSYENTFKKYAEAIKPKKEAYEYAKKADERVKVLEKELKKLIDEKGKLGVKESQERAAQIRIDLKKAREDLVTFSDPFFGTKQIKDLKKYTAEGLSEISESKMLKTAKDSTSAVAKETGVLGIFDPRVQQAYASLTVTKGIQSFGGAIEIVGEVSKPVTKYAAKTLRENPDFTTFALLGPTSLLIPKKEKKAIANIVGDIYGGTSDFIISGGKYIRTKPEETGKLLIEAGLFEVGGAILKTGEITYRAAKAVEVGKILAKKETPVISGLEKTLGYTITTQIGVSAAIQPKEKRAEYLGETLLGQGLPFLIGMKGARVLLEAGKEIKIPIKGGRGMAKEISLYSPDLLAKRYEIKAMPESILEAFEKKQITKKIIDPEVKPIYDKLKKDLPKIEKLLQEAKEKERQALAKQFLADIKLKEAQKLNEQPNEITQRKLKQAEKEYEKAKENYDEAFDKKTSLDIFTEQKKSEIKSIETFNTIEQIPKKKMSKLERAAALQKTTSEDIARVTKLRKGQELFVSGVFDKKTLLPSAKLIAKEDYLIKADMTLKELELLAKEKPVEFKLETSTLPREQIAFISGVPVKELSGKAIYVGESKGIKGKRGKLIDGYEEIVGGEVPKKDEFNFERVFESLVNGEKYTLRQTQEGTTLLTQKSGKRDLGAIDKLFLQTKFRGKIGQIISEPQTQIKSIKEKPIDYEVTPKISKKKIAGLYTGEIIYEGGEIVKEKIPGLLIENLSYDLNEIIPSTSKELIIREVSKVETKKKGEDVVIDLSKKTEKIELVDYILKPKGGKRVQEDYYVLEAGKIKERGPKLESETTDIAEKKTIELETRKGEKKSLDYETFKDTVVRKRDVQRTPQVKIATDIKTSQELTFGEGYTFDAGTISGNKGRLQVETKLGIVEEIKSGSVREFLQKEPGYVKLPEKKKDIIERYLANALARKIGKSGEAIDLFGERFPIPELAKETSPSTITVGAGDFMTVGERKALGVKQPGESILLDIQNLSLQKRKRIMAENPDYRPEVRITRGPEAKPVAPVEFKLEATLDTGVYYDKTLLSAIAAREPARNMISGRAKKKLLELQEQIKRSKDSKNKSLYQERGDIIVDELYGQQSKEIKKLTDQYISKEKELQQKFKGDELKEKLNDLNREYSNKKIEISKNIQEKYDEKTKPKKKKIIQFKDLINVEAGKYDTYGKGLSTDGKLIAELSKKAEIEVISDYQQTAKRPISAEEIANLKKYTETRSAIVGRGSSLLGEVRGLEKQGLKKARGELVADLMGKYKTENVGKLIEISKYGLIAELEPKGKYGRLDLSKGLYTSKSMELERLAEYDLQNRAKQIYESKQIPEIANILEPKVLTKTKQQQQLQQRQQQQLQSQFQSKFERTRPSFKFDFTFEPPKFEEPRIEPPKPTRVTKLLEDEKQKKKQFIRRDIYGERTFNVLELLEKSNKRSKLSYL